MITTLSIDELRDRFRLQVPGQPCERDLAAFLFGPETAAKGVLVEWLVREEGAGADLLALAAGIARCRLGKALVVVDVQRAFFPPEAARLGMAPESIVIVQPRTHEDAVWAVDQSLRHTEVGAVLAWVGPFMNRLDSKTLRRWRLAVERSGASGLFVSSERERPRGTFADVRLLVEPVPWAARNRRRWRITPLYQRGGRPGEPVELEWNDETHLVRPISELADPAPAAC